MGFEALGLLHLCGVLTCTFMGMGLINASSDL